MDKQEELMLELWRLADGDCSPQEEKNILLKISEKEEWSTAWQEIKILHGTLGGIPVRQPSAVFRKKLLARVPVRKGQYYSAKLLSTRAKWLLVGGFAFFTLAVAISASQFEDLFLSSLNLDTLLSAFRIDLLAMLENRLPSVSIALFSLGVATILLLDRLVLANLLTSRKLNRD